MLQGEHSAILSTFIKLPFAIKTFVLSIFEWLLKTGFTVLLFRNASQFENSDPNYDEWNDFFVEVPSKFCYIFPVIKQVSAFNTS